MQATKKAIKILSFEICSSDCVLTKKINVIIHRAHNGRYNLPLCPYEIHFIHRNRKQNYPLYI